MGRKYVFIKDEAYSSNLYNNALESLGDIDAKFGGAEVYKIKLMTTTNAEKLIGSNPMMLSANHIKTKHERGISLVSFGGTVLDIPIDKMMYEASNTGASYLASFKKTNKEAELLAAAETFDNNKIKEEKGLGFIYLVMLNLKETDIYYLITNPTLVHCTGHIELEGKQVWLQQIKGVVSTLKDSLFPIKITPEPYLGHVFSGGLCTIDYMNNSIILPEDRERIFSQLKLKIKISSTANQITSDCFTAVTHNSDTPLKIEIINELIPVNEKEKLSWEFILIKHNGELNG